MAIRKIVSRSIGVDVIVAEDLANNSITAAEITNGAVTADKLASNSVTTAKLDSAGISATFAAGAVGTPSITTAGDTNTGIFFPAADTIGFAEGGAEAMRIDSSGNVGIATTTPSTYGKFAVVGASANRAFYADANAQPVARYDDNSFISAGFILRNTGLTASNQGIGILFQLGTGGTAVNSGSIEMRSEADYSTSANQDAAMTFSTVLNGTSAERARIDSSGNVGIGTSSPVAKLAVVGGTSNASSLATAYSLAAFNITPKSTSGYSLQFGSGPGDLPYIQMSAGGTASGDMTLQPYGGNVGIGTSSPTVKLDVVGGRSFFAPASEAFAVGAKFNSTGGAFYFGASSASATPDGVFSQAGGAERMRITDAGNLLVGRTTTGGTAAVSVERPSNTATYIYQIKNGQVECTWGFKASTDTNMYIGSGSTSVGTHGVYLTNTGSSWNAVSDERMKTIVEPIENAADKVALLRAVIGYYNNDEKQIRRPFLIAQDVQAVLPEAVNVQDIETGTLGMSYTDTIPLLVAAIKEQQDLITALTARITALEGTP